MIEVYENAILATPRGIFNGLLVIDRDRGAILPPKMASRAQVYHDASHWVLYPALINAHDHLEFNHYPRTRWRKRYENASQWAGDMQRRLEKGLYADLRALPLNMRCMIGGLKNLFSGVTTVAHHNPFHAPLRVRDFPTRIAQPYAWSHSLYLTPPNLLYRDYLKSLRGAKYFIHLAEGSDQAAAHEVYELDHLGVLSTKTILIHGVGLQEEGLELALQKSGGLVWCPSSNVFLLGKTASVQDWYAAGKLMLGSDSRLTADGDLLDELRAANATGQLSPQALFHLVTDYPARLLGLKGLGDLQAGYRADVFALPRPAHSDYYQHLLNARRSDIQWVMRDGKILWHQTEDDPHFRMNGRGYRMSAGLYRLSASVHSMVGLETVEERDR